MTKSNPIVFPPKPAMDLSKAFKEIENAAKLAKPILLQVIQSFEKFKTIKKQKDDKRKSSKTNR